ncbi:Hypothetical protein FKW44_011680, partial [Caligus rogercresseyi]
MASTYPGNRLQKQVAAVKTTLSLSMMFQNNLYREGAFVNPVGVKGSYGIIICLITSKRSDSMEKTLK